MAGVNAGTNCSAYLSAGANPPDQSANVACRTIVGPTIAARRKTGPRASRSQNGAPTRMRRSAGLVVNRPPAVSNEVAAIPTAGLMAKRWFPGGYMLAGDQLPYHLWMVSS